MLIPACHPLCPWGWQRRSSHAPGARRTLEGGPAPLARFIRFSLEVSLAHGEPLGVLATLHLRAHGGRGQSTPAAQARHGMSSSSNDSGRADPPDPGSEQRLLNRMRRGSSSAVGALFERYAPWLRRRASGRLPQWARSGVATSDLVQDVLHHAFARLNWFESKHVSALRVYLRRAVENRVQDEMRRAIRRLDMARLAPGEEPLRPFEDAAPQYQQLLHDEMWGRYREGLKRLKVRDRRLIVGRAELGYNYEQLAAIERLPSPDAARKALKRAVIRLSEVMPLASGR